MRIIFIFAPLVAAIVLVAFLMGLKPDPPKKERIDLDPVVDVMELKPMSTKFELQSQGTVRPRTETILSAEVAGTIVSISPKFVAGGVFQRNEVLMRIDPTNYDVELRQAEALVNQRQIEFDGTSKLRSQGYRAETEYASAAASLATAKANIVRAQRNLERTYIRLPYEGMVRGKETDLGQFVSPGTRLGVVFATDYAEIRLPLTDVDLAFIDLPDAADISATGASDGPLVMLSATQKGVRAQWPATIVRSEGVVDESSRVTYAVARVEDPYRLHSKGSSLPVGTFVAASIEGLTAERVVQVPRNFVRGAAELIFVDGDGRLNIRAVDVVRTEADYVYIDGTNSVGERIVTTALESPMNGMTVRIHGETDDSGNAVPTVGSGEE